MKKQLSIMRHESVKDLRTKKADLTANIANLEAKIKVCRAKLVNSQDLDYLDVEVLVNLVRSHQSTIKTVRLLLTHTENLLKEKDLDYQETTN